MKNIFSYHGYLVCVPITNNASLHATQQIVHRILEGKDVADPMQVPMVLVGTKSDLQSERQVSASDIASLTSTIGMPYIETSAKTNTNIKEAFHMVIQQYLSKQQQQQNTKSSCSLM